MSSTSSVQGDQMNEQLVDEDILTARDIGSPQRRA